MRSDLATSAAQALGDGFPLLQPSCGVPGPPEVCKESWEAYKSGAFDGLTCLVRLLSQFTLGVDLPSAATEDGETHSSIMFKLRERDGLHEPYRCNSKAHRSVIPPGKLQSGNSKETFAKFVARTHRERSAQRDATKVPRHRSAARCHICRDCRVVCPRKKVVPWTAPVAGRARAASGHLVSAGCRRARQLRVFTGREPVATCPSRSPGERARRTQAMSLRERNSHGSHASKISQKKQNAGHDHRARRGRQQDRAGQAQEGPDERLDGPLRLRGEDSRGFLRLFGDRGLRHQFPSEVDRYAQPF